MTHVLRPRSNAAGPDRGRLAELGDEALLGLARAGTTAAFAELYRRHRPAASRLARRLAGGRVEADDVVAETFARVLRVLQAGGGPTDGFRVYLLTAVRRTAWYLQDKGSRELPVDVVALDRPACGPDFELAAAERGLLVAAFTSLPLRWRTVLWHTDVEGEPARQVARILGISPNGVAALAYRARGALVAAYLQAHVAEPPSANCRPFAAKLGRYAADRGRGRSRNHDRIAAHLAGCADCRERVAELRDVRGSLRATAGPLLLGPAAVGYLTHGKLALLVGALVQHGKASAAAGLTGAASGEAVAQLVSHHGKAAAALTGAALTAVGALGLVATDQSVPEGVSAPVVVTATAGTAQAGGSTAGAGPTGGPVSGPAGSAAGRPRPLPTGRSSDLPGAFPGTPPGRTGQPTSTGSSGAGGSAAGSGTGADPGSATSGSPMPPAGAGNGQPAGASDVPLSSTQPATPTWPAVDTATPDATSPAGSPTPTPVQPGAEPSP